MIKRSSSCINLCNDGMISFFEIEFGTWYKRFLFLLKLFKQLEHTYNTILFFLVFDVEMIGKCIFQYLCDVFELFEEKQSLITNT